MLLANQRLPDRNQTLAGIMPVSFEMNFRERKIFKYVQMALPKKKFQCFFCDEILPYRTVPLFNQGQDSIHELII